MLLMTLFICTDRATTVFCTLSLHDALPISLVSGSVTGIVAGAGAIAARVARNRMATTWAALLDRIEKGDLPKKAREVFRSEEHTSELQSRPHLVCRLLLEKKKTKKNTKRDM